MANLFREGGPPSRKRRKNHSAACCLADRLTNRVRDGVYVVNSFSKEVRVIVIHELPRQEQNALMCLFSASAEQVKYGQQHHRLRSREGSSVVHELYGKYLREANMPIDLKEYAQQAWQKIYEQMTPEERRRFLEKMSTDERLAGLDPDQRMAGLTPEQIAARLNLEQRLAGLSSEELEAIRRLAEKKAADAQSK
jgi:hypothetical protein